MTFTEKLLVNLFDFFVEISSAGIEFDSKMLVVIRLQVV